MTQAQQAEHGLHISLEDDYVSTDESYDPAQVTESLHDGATFDELILHDLCRASSMPRDAEDLRELLNSFPALLDPLNSELRNKCLGLDAPRVEMLVGDWAVYHR